MTPLPQSMCPLFRSLRRGALLGVVLVALLTSPARAAPGDLDSTFGTGGIVIEDFPNNGWGEAPRPLQRDGKLVMSGHENTVASGLRNIGIVRYLTDGSHDPTFGDDGVVITDLGGQDFARDVVIQQDGKILAGGGGGPGYDFALVRYLPDGTPDPSFGDGGVVLTNFTGNDVIRGLAIQRDGKIVAAGFLLSSGSNFGVARYNSDGSLDTTFGDGGKVITDFGGNDLARGVALQGTRIVVVGYSNYDFALARYTSNGALDLSFDDDGLVTTDFGADDVCRAIAVQRDGRIICAGYTGHGGGLLHAGEEPLTHGADWAMARYLFDGSLDPAFGAGGMVISDIGEGEHARTVGIQKDGKIVLAGHVAEPVIDALGMSPAEPLGEAAPGDFAIGRYNPDGSLDTTFGIGGWVVTELGADDGVRDIVIQRDGKVVAAGISGGFGGYQYALARYLIT